MQTCIEILPVNLNGRKQTIRFIISNFLKRSIFIFNHFNSKCIDSLIFDKLISLNKRYN